MLYVTYLNVKSPFRVFAPLDAVVQVALGVVRVVTSQATGFSGAQVFDALICLEPRSHCSLIISMLNTTPLLHTIRMSSQTHLFV